MLQLAKGILQQPLLTCGGLTTLLEGRIGGPGRRGLRFKAAASHDRGCYWALLVILLVVSPPANCSADLR